MKKSFLLKVKKQLLAQRSDILKQNIKEVDVDLEGDETDEIQGKLLLQLTAQLSMRNANKLSQIDDALKHIEDNTYGLCIDCNESIAEKRLLSNPYFQTCIQCAEDREKEAKQRKRF